MATYIQGVTDYIPQYQPFEPDYNFYQNIMQTKQSQYDSNWKALNNMYSEYYNADLTRDNNIKKRDTYLKDIEFNLKRVSQLDLSLEQNVNQASQVFKPFYSDAGLMGDIVRTKKAKSEISYGESLKYKNDKVLQDKYWSEGIEKIKYELEDYKNATEEEALTFNISGYTPNVNLYDATNKIAKDFGNVQFAPEFKNGYIITTTNGEKLIEPLSKLFESSLGNNAAVIDKFKTEAYVQRKRYAESNASQFGGDKLKAEQKYLEDTFTILKNQVVLAYQENVEKNKVYEAKMLDIEKQIKDGKASPNSKLAYEQYKLNKSINDKNLQKAKENVELINNGRSDIVSTEFVNPYKDLKSLRYKVDNGKASLLMNKELDEYAQLFAIRGQKFDYKVDQYSLLAQKFKNDQSIARSKNAATIRSARITAKGSTDAAKITASNKSEEAYGKYLVENGKAVPKLVQDKNGFNKIVYVPIESSNRVPGTSGQSVDETNYRKTVNDRNFKLKTKRADMVQDLSYILKTAVEQNFMTHKESEEILKGTGLNAVYFVKKLESFGDNNQKKLAYINSLGSANITAMVNNFDKFYEDNSNLSIFEPGQSLASRYIEAKNEYDRDSHTIKYLDKERIRTANLIEKELQRTGNPNAIYLYNEQGYMRSKEEFNLAVAAAGKKTKDERGFWSRTKDFIPIYNILTDKDNQEYEFLEKEAYKAGKDKKIVIKDTGKSSEQVSISLDRVTDEGVQNFEEVTADMDQFRLGDDNDYFSFKGNNTDSFEDDEDKELGIDLYNKIIQDYRKGNKDLKNLTVVSAGISGSKDGYSSYSFRPSDEYIDKITKDPDDKDKGGSLLTTEQAKSMKKYGLTYMMKTDKFNSSVMRETLGDPFVQSIDKDNTYSYKDKYDPNNNYKVSRRNGELIINGQISVYDESKGKNVGLSFTEDNIDPRDLRSRLFQLESELFPAQNGNNNLEFNMNNLETQGYDVNK